MTTKKSKSSNNNIEDVTEALNINILKDNISELEETKLKLLLNIKGYIIYYILLSNIIIYSSYFYISYSKQ